MRKWKDYRYKEEKEVRKKLNEQKHIKYTKRYIISKRKAKKLNSNYDDLKI